MTRKTAWHVSGYIRGGASGGGGGSGWTHGEQELIPCAKASARFASCVTKYRPIYPELVLRRFKVMVMNMIFFGVLFFDVRRLRWRWMLSTA